MGSLAKRLGQWSRKSLESESASIFRGMKANKAPGSLSLLLDGTLKEGHDMTVFGVGTLATMASRARYGQFLTNFQAIYSTMEEELDAASMPAIKSETIRLVWDPHQGILRRNARLNEDIEEINLLVDETNNVSRVSPCTLRYIQAIRQAGEADRESGGGRLLGHLYCRYFADLFGGQMLGRPYELALQLPRSPRHLEFEFSTSRQVYLEQLYTDLNKAGNLLESNQMEQVRKESILAFQHNVHVYSEEPRMMVDAAKGGLNSFLGWATSLSR